MARDLDQAAASIAAMSQEEIELFAQRDPDIFRDLARAFIEGRKQRPCPLCGNEDPECELCGGEPKRAALAKAATPSDAA